MLMTEDEKLREHEVWQAGEEYREILERAGKKNTREPLSRIELLALLGESISRTYTYAEKNYE